MVKPQSILIAPLPFSTVFGALIINYEWMYIDFEWKDRKHRQNAIDSGNYIAANVYPIDVDQASDERIFITTPRDKGVPVTLSTLTDKIGPLLRPYPDWDWNSRTDCTGIISVYRVTIDKCNRLYVLDSGKSGNTQVCPAQLLIFDLSNDHLIKRVTIPSKYAANANGTSRLITPAVETRGRQCEETTVYMSDVDGWGLVVWNGTDLRRFESETFNAETKYSNFTILGESFYHTDGIFSLALQPKKYSWESTKLFYRPMASVSQYFVRTDQLKSQFYSGYDGKPDYQKMSYTFPTQVSAEAFSHDGILFFGYVGTTAIGCWNSHKPMNDENVVTLDKNPVTLQFSSTIKVIREQLWMFTDPYPKLDSGTVNISEVNYRIPIARNITKFVQDTNCQP